MIIDFCVIPPLPETLKSFANPTGDFAAYNQMYAEQSQLIDSLMENPQGGLVDLMDEGGVDKAVLTAEDAETTMNMRTPNEKVAEFVKLMPDRFIGMAAVDPHKGMQALEDLEYAVKELEMKALCLEPWLHKLRSNDKRYYPIYAKCVELEIPVWIHTSINFVPSLQIDFGRPIHLDEVAGHFPDLILVAGHGGWPWVNEMIAVAWRHKNVMIDISAIRPKYLAKPGSGWETLVTYGNTVLQDRIVFGTAWPMQSFRETVDGIRNLPLKQSVMAKWLGDNARRILKI
jgi:predicted TIM-barrel fold metal-dependent hydrolase